MEQDFTCCPEESYSRAHDLPYEQENVLGWIMYSPCSKRGIPNCWLKLNIAQRERTYSFVNKALDELKSNMNIDRYNIGHAQQVEF